MADPSDRPRFRLIQGGRDAVAPPVDVVELPAERAAPRKARHWVSRIAAKHGVVGMENQTIELLTGELVGLAARSCAPGATIRLEVTRTDSLVEVTAHHPPGECAVVPSPLDVEEWGTALLRTLSLDCGIAEADGGTLTSWFRIEVPA